MSESAAVARVRQWVRTRRDSERAEGKVSLAHDIDHLETVGRFAAVLVPRLAPTMGVDADSGLSELAEMCGLTHDIIRTNDQSGTSEADSAKLLLAEYNNIFPRGELEQGIWKRYVVDVVRHSDKGPKEIALHFARDPEVALVAKSLAAADKFEASGFRVLERRPFFVGRERMLTGDLGGVFSHPDESYLAVLMETIVRLGGVNHVANYQDDPALARLADRLHAVQYPLYAGLIRATGATSEEDAHRIIANRLAVRGASKLAVRFQDPSERMLRERHLKPAFFQEAGFPTIAATVAAIPDDAAESALDLVALFALATTPDLAIGEFERNARGPKTFRIWMAGISRARSPGYSQELVRMLDNGAVAAV